MKRQEIFNKVALHLLKQGKRAIQSTRFGDSCRYRAEGGLMCAAGCLIKDEFFLPAFEDKNVKSNPVIQDALTKSGVNCHNKTTRSLVCALQNLHDDFSVDPSQWRAMLRGFAIARGLSTEVL